MDGDDECNQNRLRKQVDLLENNWEIAMIGTWAYLVVLKENEIVERRLPTEHKRIIK